MEERCRDGLLHGVCRQWDAGGKLLGEFEMNHGTGVQREWHHNGRLKIEVSTVRGVFCGRNRLWLRDGTLLSEHFYLRGKDVSADEYRSAAKLDRTLPRLRGRVGKPLPEGTARRQRIHGVFVRGLLGKPNRSEAAQWLRSKADDKTRRFLGRFKREVDAAKFVEALYQAGAAEVIVPDIYHDKRGNQFADALVVRLPKSPAQRRAVRAVGDKLRKQKRGAVEPETDIGERHLYLSMA